MDLVLQFENENEKLKSMFAETRDFEAVIFYYSCFRRYKFNKETLGIKSPFDLLIPSSSSLKGFNPDWDYYLYPSCKHFSRSVDGLCGEVHQVQNRAVKEKEYHIFLSKDKRSLKVIFVKDFEYVLEQRTLMKEVFVIKKEEKKANYIMISYDRFASLLNKKRRVKRLSNI